MTKKTEIHLLADKLCFKGMDYKLAFKNLLQCDRDFIEELDKIL